MRPTPLLLAALVAILATACGSASTADGGRLTVFAAASLTQPFQEIATDFETANPGVAVSFNFAGSQILATQVLETSAADVYASANPRQMTRVREAGRVSDPRVFATNRMVIVVPAGNPAGITRAGDLADDGTQVVLGGPAVPAGVYARESLRRLGLWQRVEPNVVSHEDDVKQVIGKVVTGVADAGIVYRSDVTAEVAPDVDVIPLDTPVRARYLIAPTTTTRQPELARDFVDYVRRHGGPALRRAGFDVPAAASAAGQPAGREAAS